MGSKTAMLGAGLSQIISTAVMRQPERFVDLFSGSGAVARWVAENHTLPVDAVDSQLYAKILSGAIIERHEKASYAILNDWIMISQELYRDRVRSWGSSLSSSIDSDEVYAERALAGEIRTPGFIARQYGGHYYSINQGLAFDSLMECLPHSLPERSVALAAIIESASSCAASPGHTAQPFQPTEKLIKHIDAAWRRDPFAFASRKASSYAGRYALRAGGKASQQDALQYVKDSVGDGNVVFCDPPYSEVQYSRFYHVLEGIARGGWDDVYGAGRAPLGESRFSSTFSSRKESTAAFDALFRGLATRSATVILTFPNHECSNGQSADSLIKLAQPWFEVTATAVNVTHSSLGASEATGGSRVPRREVKESVLLFSPRA